MYSMPAAKLALLVPFSRVDAIEVALFHLMYACVG